MLLLVSLSPCEISITFMVGALLLAYYIPFLKLLSIALLTIILFSTLGVVYEIKNLSLLSFFTYLLQSRLLLWISILLQYNIEDVKYAEDALELFVLDETNLSQRVSMSMSMLEMFWTIRLSIVSLIILKINIYVTSLISTTM